MLPPVGQQVGSRLLRPEVAVELLVLAGEEHERPRVDRNPRADMEHPPDNDDVVASRETFVDAALKPRQGVWKEGERS